mmetsp:Transcript_32631/g.65467  ORF Transcript_32631/g.65467 Transcript_32631/m.65467 type:complete len:235 (-) Transcript_32631:1231-1935(-)
MWFPGSSKTSSFVFFFTTVNPRIASMSSWLPSAPSRAHPSFTTVSLLMVTVAPGFARMTSAPCTSSLPWMWMSPSRTRALLAEIEMSASGEMRALTEERHVPKEGCRMTIGEKESLIPPKLVSTPSVGTFAPARASSLQLSAIASRSPDPALSTGMPCSPLTFASWMLFLTGEKQIQRSSCVKPTIASAGRRRGKSCIMHSRRVGFLNAVLLASVYLGFTNSFIFPSVALRTAW